MAKVKRVKLEPKARIRRRLMRLWVEAVRRRAGDKCEVSMVSMKGLNAHHIEARANRALRYDPRNGILLTPLFHKFGKDSFHRSPAWSMHWMALAHPEKLQYILDHRDDEIDLNDRAVLAKLEEELRK